MEDIHFMLKWSRNVFICMVMPRRLYDDLRFPQEPLAPEQIKFETWIINLNDKDPDQDTQASIMRAVYWVFARDISLLVYRPLYHSPSVCGESRESFLIMCMSEACNKASWQLCCRYQQQRHPSHVLVTSIF
ncbi:hypothetical protein BDR07DRAFT_1045446 [Suillus spraguei]|nr:hypothetical protein BDR07DRAFT_1045446 [Suillus spraguei]